MPFRAAIVRKAQGGIAHACSSGFCFASVDNSVGFGAFSCDPVIDFRFSCDPVVTVFYPILVCVDPEPFLVVEGQPSVLEFVIESSSQPGLLHSG